MEYYSIIAFVGDELMPVYGWTDLSVWLVQGVIGWFFIGILLMHFKKLNKFLKELERKMDEDIFNLLYLFALPTAMWSLLCAFALIDLCHDLGTYWLIVWALALTLLPTLVIKIKRELCY